MEYQGFGFKVLWFGVLGLGYPGFGFKVFVGEGLGYQGFGFKVLWFGALGLRYSGFGFKVLGFGHPVAERCLGRAQQLCPSG